MGRLKRASAGFSLIEVIVASTLAFVVVLTASNLLINFGKFTSTTIRAESDMMAAALGAMEDIAGRIQEANAVAIMNEAAITAYPVGCAANSCIQIRVDQKISGQATPSDFTDDVVHTFWRLGRQIQYTSTNLETGAISGTLMLAQGITKLEIERDPADMSRISIKIRVEGASSPTGDVSREHLETIANMRSSRGGS